MDESEVSARVDPSTKPETPTNEKGRRAPVPKRKKPGPYRVPPRAQRHGLVIINTGDGKGKTTGALGLLFRASGRSMRVGMWQFMKATGITAGGEYAALGRLGIEITSLGAGCTLGVADTRDSQTLAKDGWEHCKSLLAAGEFDVLVFDELTLPLDFGWLDTADIVDALRSRSEGTHVVITGRRASAELIEAADLVTEMRVIKHPYHEKKLRAQAGIDV